MPTASTLKLRFSYLISDSLFKEQFFGKQSGKLRIVAKFAKQYVIGGAILVHGSVSVVLSRAA